MDAQVEKVYVALGNDLQDGFKTLDWTLGKWKSKSISIVILHFAYNISHDFVYTPLGKFPASAVNDDKLEVLRKYEQQKVESLLSEYKAFCGKVKAEVLKIEKSSEPIHKVMVDLISTLKIRKLVMGITFMNSSSSSSSWRSKSAISSLLKIQQHKQFFCQFFIICEGKLVFLKEENEGVFIEDDQGVIIAKRNNFKSWIGKIFTDNSTKSLHSSKSLDFCNPGNRWEDYLQEIEVYFEYLSSLKLDEEILEEENDVLQSILMELEDDVSMSVDTKMEHSKRKIDEAQIVIQSEREETIANAERSAKAERAISLCNDRVEKLEAQIKQESTSRAEIAKCLDAEKEQIEEIVGDIKEIKNRLSSLVELQSELSNKLRISTMTRSHMEAQLEKAVAARAQIVREIEVLRHQRDVFQRRIEFCREKDAIGKAKRLTELCCSCREYNAEDIRLATDDFSESLRLKSGGNWTNVYRGRINGTTVAIKMLQDENALSREDFLAKVKIINSIRHPHLVAMLGFCSELKSIVFEYMHNGSLRDIFSSQRSHKRRNLGLGWYDRIRIAHEVGSGLGFLHSAKPRPVALGRLTASNILLDGNLVAKISGHRFTSNYDEEDVQHNIRDFGVILGHLLNGRNWAGPNEEVIRMDPAALVQILDERAGEGKLELAEELAGIAVGCVSVKREPSTYGTMAEVMKKLGELRRKADELAARGGCEVLVDEHIVDKEDSSEVPSFFLCPIVQVRPTVSSFFLKIKSVIE
uniref:RING-type E3 ubiquitin transferase n=1 Tax=Rhizophora mucronata TaxID=61149 RepID=A0A2P2KQ60_RHIMU